jgi:hypothetical protein
MLCLHSGDPSMPPALHTPSEACSPPPIHKNVLLLITRLRYYLSWYYGGLVNHVGEVHMVTTIVVVIVVKSGWNHHSRLLYTMEMKYVDEAVESLTMSLLRAKNPPSFTIQSHSSTFAKHSIGKCIGCKMLIRRNAATQWVTFALVFLACCQWRVQPLAVLPLPQCKWNSRHANRCYKTTFNAVALPILPGMHFWRFRMVLLKEPGHYVLYSREKHYSDY